MKLAHMARCSSQTKRLRMMPNPPRVNEPKSLYEMNWAHAQDGKLAIDAETGILIDVNPAAEALTGYSRAELIGIHVAMLHPEAERARIGVEVEKAMHLQNPHYDFHDFHIQRKDGRRVPVAIWSTEKLELDGRALVIGQFRNITEEKEREHRLATQNWALSAYSIAALALGRAQSAEGLMQSICEAITRESPYVLAWIGVAEDGQDKKIQFAAQAGTAVGYLDGLHLSWDENDQWGQGPAGICVRTDALQLADDIETSLAFNPWRERARRFGIRSSAFVPLHFPGGCQGLLCVYATRLNAFGTAPIEIFRRLAEQIAHGIDALQQKQLLEAERQTREETQKRLAGALAASVAAIVTAMEMRDPYTAGHESRVAEIAVAIGKEMGWPEDRLDGLRIAATLHDIGKISIPAEILNKPDRLSPEEWTLVKQHPDSSYAILKDIPFSWPVADMVRQHHEKLDGSGYPLGLKENAILPESKILAVADIVEAMATDRPYRATLGLDFALKEIERLAGTLLDAEVVRVCTTLFREKRLILNGTNHS
jgi:PAS domain S-box-containing protein